MHWFLLRNLLFKLVLKSNSRIILCYFEDEIIFYLGIMELSLDTDFFSYAPPAYSNFT